MKSLCAILHVTPRLQLCRLFLPSIRARDEYSTLRLREYGGLREGRKLAP